jgi:hypothetical protein
MNLALAARPSDFLEVYILFEHRGSYLDDSTDPYRQIWMKEAWVDADMMALMGWTPTDLVEKFHVVVGEQYNRYGEFGLAFDNGYMAMPGLSMQVDGDRLHFGAFLARNSRFGTQEGIGVGRVAYDFGESRSTVRNADEFATIGFTYLGNGAGYERAYGADLKSELLSEVYLNLVRVEWLQMVKDQLGFDVENSYGSDFATSVIFWLDLYNDGNTRVSAAYADIGLLPGFSSVDNNPFEEYDYLFTGIGGNVNWAYESGLNPFPSNFQGGGMQIEHTWWDVLHTMLTFYDGQNQSEEDLPAVIILHCNYPLSDASDIRLTYIHSGIDALTLAKLRGEFLVRY